MKKRLTSEDFLSLGNTKPKPNQTMTTHYTYNRKKLRKKKILSAFLTRCTPPCLHTISFFQHAIHDAICRSFNMQYRFFQHAIRRPFNMQYNIGSFNMRYVGLSTYNIVLSTCNIVLSTCDMSSHNTRCTPSCLQHAVPRASLAELKPDIIDALSALCSS